MQTMMISLFYNGEAALPPGGRKETEKKRGCGLGIRGSFLFSMDSTITNQTKLE